MLVDLFQTGIEPWVWFASGLVLIGLELIVPGSFLLWFGAAGLIMGFIVAYFQVDWRWQLVGWAVLSLLLLFIGRKLTLRRQGEDEDPHLNRRGSRYVGQTVELETDLQHGSGTVKIGDSIWRVTGPDLVKGTNVKIIAVDGPVLRVEATDKD